MDIETAFVEKGKYRNYYEGYSNIQFPNLERNKGLVESAYYMLTSRTSGTVKTAWYGEPFNEDEFEYKARNIHHIFFPTNLPNISHSFPGLTFVMHFHMDVALFEGAEYVYIARMGKTGETYDHYYYDEPQEEVYYKEESLFKTGNISIIRKYNASKFQQLEGEEEKVDVVFIRSLEKSLVDQSPEKRNTG